jgi:hypothetical protein
MQADRHSGKAYDSLIRSTSNISISYAALHVLRVAKGAAASAAHVTKNIRAKIFGERRPSIAWQADLGKWYGNGGEWVVVFVACPISKCKELYSAIWK